MVRKIHLIYGLIACGFLVTSGCAKEQPTSSQGNVGAVVAKHDKQLRAELGIGIVSAGLIAQIGPNSYLLEDALKSAEKKAYDELSDGGYVVMEKMSAKEGVFVRFRLTEKGIALQNAID